MNLTFSQKTTFSFAAISLLGILIAVIGTMSSRSILEDSRVFTENILPSTDSLLQLDRDLHQALIAQLSLDRATDENRRSLVNDVNENIEQVEERWESLQVTAAKFKNARANEMIRIFESSFADWKRESEKALVLLDSTVEANHDKGLTIVHGSAAEAFNLAREQINKLTEELEQQVEIIKAQAEATASNSLVSIFAAAGVCLVTSIFLTWTMGYKVAQKLKAISIQLRESATQTSETSAQISDSSRRVAEGASEQAASLEETSSSLEEGAATAEKSASSAHRIKEVSEETSKSAQEGATEMKTMTEAMQLIAEASNNIANTLKTIDEIAFQTNILALNAAVEAARAGEAGAGFAVVADEVRALAQRCAEAARETSSRIDESTQRSEQGLRTSELVSKRLEQICAKAIEMDELMSSLANSTTEQSAGISQINIAVSQMDQVTQTNAAVAEETASATVQLDKQTALMHEMVEQLSGLVEGTHISSSRTTTTPARSKPDSFDHDFSSRNGNHDTKKLDALFSN